MVDILRTAAEAEVAAVLKQVGPARWTVSLRARGRVGRGRRRRLRSAAAGIRGRRA